ncbi:MAG: hypothetical protein ACTIA6_18040 [Pseudoclavibacter sp.]
MTDNELFAQARDANFEFKAAVAQVQLQLVDGDWEMTDYGAAPDDCSDGGDKYEFQMERYYPATNGPATEWKGWRFNEEPMDIVFRVGQWLDEHGWTDIRHRTYSEKVDNVVLQAKNADAGVSRLDIDINPGKTFDSVSITAYSTCHPGDHQRIFQLQTPYDSYAPPTTDLPLSEHPTASPQFGSTPERERIYWPDEWEAALKAAE